MKKGEIYAPHWYLLDCDHYIVCMEDCPDDTTSFKAVLITHSESKEWHKFKNMPMAENWFDPDHKVHYDNSFVVCQPIEKKTYKVDYTQGVVGQLSSLGIKRVEELVAFIQTIESTQPLNRM